MFLDFFAMELAGQEEEEEEVEEEGEEDLVQMVRRLDLDFLVRLVRLVKVEPTQDSVEVLLEEECQEAIQWEQWDQETKL